MQFQICIYKNEKKKSCEDRSRYLRFASTIGILYHSAIVDAWYDNAATKGWKAGQNVS